MEEIYLARFLNALTIPSNKSIHQREFIHQRSMTVESGVLLFNQSNRGGSFTYSV